MQVTLSLGLASPMVIETPLMWIDKADTWEMARTLGGPELIELIREYTHTCYVGDHSTKYEWGFGCGECSACILRKNGFSKFEKVRPT